MSRREKAPPAPDGRHQRAARTRTALLAATRHLMMTGVLTPTAEQIATKAKYSARSVFFRYPSLTELYSEALDDPAVARWVVDYVLKLPTVTDQAKAIVCGTFHRFRRPSKAS